MLRLFARRALITPEAAAEMRRWEHGDGSSLDAAVRIEATDRKGLERRRSSRHHAGTVTAIIGPWPHRFAGRKTGQRSLVLKGPTPARGSAKPRGVPR
jgi:hypothetical protein